PETANGMTFVDLVFPAFLFIVGLSIPLAFASRLRRGDAMWKLVLHVLARTGGLLLLGVFMVNGESGPDVTKIGWPPHLWHFLLFGFGILAFLAPPGKSRNARAIGIALRIVGFTGLAFLGLVYRDKNDHIMQ